MIVWCSCLIMLCFEISAGSFRKCFKKAEDAFLFFITRKDYYKYALKLVDIK